MVDGRACGECGAVAARITRGLCRSCYDKAMCSGRLSPLVTHYYLPVAERLALYTNRSGGPSACWEWLGWRDGCGYGKMTANGKRRGAHRIAFELEHGVSLDSETIIRHTCDNPACCNPAHLVAGTVADNVADRNARQRQAKGERNGRAKLTREDVIRIRADVSAGVPKNRLAKAFGVHPVTIDDLVRRKNWAHV